MATPLQPGGELAAIARDLDQYTRWGLGEPTFLVGAVDSVQPTFGLTLTAPDDIGIISFVQDCQDPTGVANDCWVARIETQTRTVFDGSAITVSPAFPAVQMPFMFHGFVVPIFLTQGSTIRFEARSLSAGGSRRLSVICEAYIWPGGGRGRR